MKSFKAGIFYNFAEDKKMRPREALLALQTLKKDN
jgi:hypothetical protein